MSREDFIITVYCLIDALLKKRGFNPALSDFLLITMKIIAEFLRIDKDKGAWEYFCNHWRNWFPAIRSRAIKQQMQKELATQLGAFSDSLCRYVISDEQIAVKYL